MNPLIKMNIYNLLIINIKIKVFEIIFVDKNKNVN